MGDARGAGRAMALAVKTALILKLREQAMTAGLT